MKTKTINLYSFDELSEKAKSKAIENLYDINVNHEWWDSTYEDAKNIGIKITGFDTGRRNDITGEFILSSHEVAANIIRDHGETCETNKTAQTFLDSTNSVQCEYPDGEGEEYESQMMELEDEFLNSILEDYLTILRDEYEYLTSDEAIIETIQANEYTFTEIGKLEN